MFICQLAQFTLVGTQCYRVRTMTPQKDYNTDHFAGWLLITNLELFLAVDNLENTGDSLQDTILGKLVAAGYYGRVYVDDQNSRAYKIVQCSSDGDQERIDKEVGQLKALGQLRDIPIEKQAYVSTLQGESVFAMQTLSALNAVRSDLFEYLQFYKTIRHYKNSPELRIILLMFISHMSDLITQVVSAMQFAHGKSIFHGDLKPENILLSISYDGRLQAMVCDWGGGDDKTTGYFFCRTKLDHKDDVTDKAVSKAQDVYGFIRTLKVDCFVEIYQCLKKSIREALPLSFLLKKLLECNAVKQMGELGFHTGYPHILGTFDDLMQSINELNRVDRENMSSTLNSIKKLLSTKLHSSHSKAVQLEWLTLAEYYWRIKADLDPAYLTNALNGISEWCVESNRDASIQDIKVSIRAYQDQSNSAWSCCFRGKIGRERAEKLQQDIDNLKTASGVHEAVKRTCESYTGFWSGSLKSYLETKVVPVEAKPLNSSCV